VLHEYQVFLEKSVPSELTRPRAEFLFNHASAIIVLVAAFVIHTAGLFIRMYLQGRPPVTNLYSSAIFVGWGIVVLCLFLERIYRNGVASLCASAAGFTTLLIAYNLQLDASSSKSTP
jgi:ABC-type transport system involved in cytochrome c biogenesis permease subunit